MSSDVRPVPVVATLSLLLSLAAGAPSATAQAVQTRVLRTLPERNPGGKLFNMEEAVLSRKAIPERKAFFWKGGHDITEERPDALAPRKWKLPQGSEGIVYGEGVSRNEFGIGGGVFPSNKGDRLAVYRKDERAVTLFPLLDISTRTGSLEQIRYPMNGMASERLSLCICDTLGRVLTTIVPTEFDDERYLCGVSWSPDDRYILLQVLDRAQHHMALNMYRSDDGRFVRTLLREENPAWVEPQDPVRFLEGRYEFIYRTDNRDGWRNLYLCDTLGGVRRLTEVNADVAYLGNDGHYVYYTSAEVSPIQNHLFRIAVKPGRNLQAFRFPKPERLTAEPGWHQVQLSPDKTRFLDLWSSFSDPGKTVLRRCDGTVERTLFEPADPLADYAACSMELGSIPSADGQFENYYRLYKPLNFNPDKKYPVIVYVYGGPHSQMVHDSWLGGIRPWEMLMAQRGYVVWVQDNRGTSNRGAAFEKAINRRCGQAEAADQMVGVNWLRSQPWVDKERVGVHGWSYGGFMTITLMTEHPDVFKAGVAGGPVIDWKWYEVMYGERYMDTPETNPEGFAQTSLLDKAERLRGRLLICQGAIDKTVVWQHSLSFVQRCIEKGVPVDYLPYPRSEHNVFGRWRIHLMDSVTDYFERNL
ncbi:MAG: S9 family peptidase [Bacteroidales bacterium]|nr:S9 family peptidase [Bacteroidales bacterium]